MDAACGVLVQKPLNGRVLAQRVQQLDLGVWQLDEDHGHAMVRLVLRCAHIGAQRIAVLVRCRFQIGHSDGYMV